MPSSQVELIYDVDVGVQNNAPGSRLFDKVANLVFDPNGETAALIGMTLAGDVTEPGPVGTIRRRLLYDLQAEANFAFPNEELIKKATRNLFGRIFEAKIPGAVSALEPVVI